jgi:cytochrome c oxidase subunit 4
MSGGHKHVSSVATYGIVWFVLMVLLLVTVLAIEIDLDHMVFPGANITLAMFIAVIKALIVVLWFMHVKDASKLTWVAAGCSFVWFGLMILLTQQDYMTRGWMPGWETPVTQLAVPAHNALPDRGATRPPHGAADQNLGPHVPLTQPR